MLLSALATAPADHRLCFALADTGDDEGLRASLISLATQLCQLFDVRLACRPSRMPAVSNALAFLPETVPVRLIASAQDEATPSALQQLALTQAGSDHVGLLRAGDRLAPTAVAAVLLTLARWPDAAVVYADEDWIAANGARCRPRFKPAWDPEAQLGFDLLDGLCIFRREEAIRAGGLRPEFGPAARYHLACSLAVPLPSDHVRHIPSVLCHRRIPRTLDAATTGRVVEAYAAAARRAAAEVASRQAGTPVEVLPSAIAACVNRVRRALPHPAPRVTVLVPTRDQAGLLGNCLEGLLRHTDYPDLEVLVLDNDSVEPQTHSLFAELRAEPRVRVLRMPGAFNFSRINNAGARAASGEVLLFLNNDIEILEEGWLKEMVAEVVRPDVGCVGAKLLYADGTVQHAGVILQRGPLAMHVGRMDDAMAAGVDGRLAGTRDYLAVTAACLAVRRGVFHQVGGFDETHLAVAFNDVDLCLKVSDAGYRNLCTPFAMLLHLESASRGQDHASEEKQRRAQREQVHIGAKWLDRFEDDPFHNPNVRMDWCAGAHLASYDAQRWRLAR